MLSQATDNCPSWISGRRMTVYGRTGHRTRDRGSWVRRAKDCATRPGSIRQRRHWTDVDPISSCFIDVNAISVRHHVRAGPMPYTTFTVITIQRRNSLYSKRSPICTCSLVGTNLDSTLNQHCFYVMILNQRWSNVYSPLYACWPVPNVFYVSHLYFKYSRTLIARTPLEP